MLRGRKAVRSQSAILDKTPEPFLLLIKTAISARMLFIRAEIAVGARRAQEHRRH
jgi:hypothetical protein